MLALRNQKAVGDLRGNVKDVAGRKTTFIGAAPFRGLEHASQSRHAAATVEDPPDRQDGGEERDELRQAETSHRARGSRARR